MKAEAKGDLAQARALFAQAWEARTDDYEACVAAHYVARHQASLEDTLTWNQKALDHGDRVSDEQIRQFYPSLYFNLGKSHEDLGSLDEANRYYRLAAERVGTLPADAYGEMVRSAIASALKRLGC